MEDDGGNRAAEKNVSGERRVCLETKIHFLSSHLRTEVPSPDTKGSDSDNCLRCVTHNIPRLEPPRDVSGIDLS